MFTEQQINDVLLDIQSRVPPQYTKGLFKRVKKTPIQEFVVKKALKSGKLEPRKQKELKLLYETGEFSKTKEEIDEAVWKKRDKYIERQINRAIKLGKLPSQEQLEKLPFYLKIKNVYAQKISK